MDIHGYPYQPCCKPLNTHVGSRCRLPSGGHIKAGAQPHRLSNVASNASWPGARHSWNHCGPVERTNHLWGALWSACDQIVSRICWTSWNRLWLYNYYKWTLGFGWIWIMISGHNNDWIILEVMGLWSDYDWSSGLLFWTLLITIISSG